MKPTGYQLRELKRQNALYPRHLVEMPREQWPPIADGQFRSGATPHTAYRSRSFLVVVWQEPNGFFRLSVNRTEWDKGKGRWRDDISWDDLQRLKAEAGFGDMCAVEIYPPDRHVVNVANMRHLFLTQAPAFMWTRTPAAEAA